MRPQVITIATANTQWGRAIQAPHSFGSLSKVDILLLQEMFNFERKPLKKQLGKVGFRILCDAPEYGLTIAIRLTSPLAYVPRSAQKHTLAQLNRLEQLFMQAITPQPLAFTKRGVLSAKLSLPNGTVITIANTHPTTPVALQPAARSRQIRTLQKLISTRYTTDKLILGGDMNHYPRPRKVDHQLHLANHLTPVDLQGEPTWYVRGSKQEKLLSLVAGISRRPLESFNGQHDIILYRKEHFTPISTEVRDIYSDHRAVITAFTLNESR